MINSHRNENHLSSAVQIKLCSKSTSKKGEESSTAGPGLDQEWIN